MTKEIKLILLGNQREKTSKTLDVGLTIEEEKKEDKIKNFLLDNVGFNRSTSNMKSGLSRGQDIFMNALKMKEMLRPQYLINYKRESDMTKVSKHVLLDKQNKKFNLEMDELNNQKEQYIKQRMKRLKYLYRKKIKGVNINLHNINQTSQNDPVEGQYKRMKQYEHYICKKIGLVSQRRDLLNQTDHPDPTTRYQSLKTSTQEKEEIELQELVDYFDQNEDDSKNMLSFKVTLVI